MKFENITGNSYVDNTVKPSNTYYYAVTAVNSAGEGKWPDRSPEAKTPAVPKTQQLLPAPTGLSVKVQGPTSVKISWNSVKGAESYTIHRTQASNGAKVKFENITGTSYVDNTVKPA